MEKIKYFRCDLFALCLSFRAVFCPQPVAVLPAFEIAFEFALRFPLEENRFPRVLAFSTSPRPVPVPVLQAVARLLGCLLSRSSTARTGSWFCSMGKEMFVSCAFTARWDLSSVVTWVWKHLHENFCFKKSGQVRCVVKMFGYKEQSSLAQQL